MGDGDRTGGKRRTLFQLNPSSRHAVGISIDYAAITYRVTRGSAVKARTQAFNTLWGVMIGAPSPLRNELVVLTKRTFAEPLPAAAPRDR